MKEKMELKIKISDQRVVTLPELYQEYDKTHWIQAGLPFEEKIRALVDLQKLAASWGNRRDVIIWKI